MAFPADQLGRADFCPSRASPNAVEAERPRSDLIPELVRDAGYVAPCAAPLAEVAADAEIEDIGWRAIIVAPDAGQLAADNQARHLRTPAAVSDSSGSGIDGAQSPLLSMLKVIGRYGQRSR